MLVAVHMNNTKKVLIISGIFVLIAFIATVVGLVVGLRSYYTDKYVLSEQQKLDECRAIGCKDNQLLDCRGF